jgi:hypothetical protein
MEQGFVKAPHDIVRDPSLSATAKVAWLLIAGMPDDCHPTREEWMAMLPCGDKRTWWRAISELEQAGLIEVSLQGTRRTYTAVHGGVVPHPLRVDAKPKSEEKKDTKQDNAESMARKRLREEVMVDLMVETGCRSCGITQEQYHRLAEEIFSDWEFSDFPDYEWSKHHFLSVLRIKAKDLKRNGVHKPTPQRRPTVTGAISGATQEENPLAGYPTYTKAGT